MAAIVGASPCCGGRATQIDPDVSPSGDAMAADVTGTTDAGSADAGPPRTCAEVRAACGPSPQMVVRGHAEGLTGVDGAAVRFAVRYLTTPGTGLGGPRPVAAGRGQVTAGSFEVCVCLPEGANNYPVIAAVVYAPGSAAQSSRDVVRAVVSQRYATLGDEDLGMALQTLPGAIETEFALAECLERTSAVTVSGLDAALEGAHVFGGLVAAARPVAAQFVSTTVAASRARFEWDAPGAAWADESLALLVDSNANARCDDGDRGAILRVDARGELPASALAWLQGAALTPVCDALRVEVARSF